MIEQNMAQILAVERAALHNFVSLYTNTAHLNHQVYPLWRVQDLLSHMVFWQEAFARNVKAMALDQPLQPLRGSMKELNEESVLGDGSIDELLERLYRAQQDIEKYTVKLPLDAQIPYRKNAQKYTPIRHVAVAAEHFTYHTKHIKNAVETGVVQ